MKQYSEEHLELINLMFDRRANPAKRHNFAVEQVVNMFDKVSVGCAYFIIFYVCCKVFVAGLY